MPRLFELSSPPGGHEAAADHRYRSLIEQSPVGITISRAARFEYLNEAAVALFGYDNAAELIGESVLTIVAPECHELVMDYYARRNRGEPAPSAYDYIVVRKDGSRADAHVEILRPGGVEDETVAYHVDITERRRSERAHAESELRFRNMADHAPVMMHVMDADGASTYFNRMWYQFTGRSEAESLGRVWLDAVHPDDVDEVLQLLAAAEGRRAPVELEFRLRRHDGADRQVLGSLAPRFEPEGEFLGLIGSLVDIHDMRRAEASNARLAAIVQSSDDAIVGKTLDGTVVSWNEAASRIFGYCEAEMIGSTIFDLIPPERHGEERAIFAQLARGEPVARLETERIRKNGSRVMIELTVSPVRDRSGRIIGAASIKRDVTERRRTEQQLRQSAKMEAIGRVAGGLAHDFNNQLHALRGFADFVGRDPGLSAVSRDDLHQVVRAADRMASLTRQLLAFSRRQVLAPETVDLDTAIAEMQPMLQRLIGSDIEMRIERAVGTKWIRFDPAQLLQVVMNLAINARDAMPGGGRLLMRTATRHLVRGEMTMADGTPVEAAEYAELTVSDSGSGILPEHLSQIFEPFFTTKRVGEGTGLGLPTVQGIVTQSRGVIQVESEPGNGTTFTVLLPVSDPPVRTQPMRGARIGGEDRSARVLVVDDEELVREVVARSLEAAGFRVHRARHGAEALEVIAQVTEPIDIIVSDVVMPVMGGRELGRRLAELRPDLPVIWMSGHPREALTDLTSDSPDRPYLQKPVTPDYLVASVQRVLKARESASDGIME